MTHFIVEIGEKKSLFFEKCTIEHRTFLAFEVFIGKLKSSEKLTYDPFSTSLSNIRNWSIFKFSDSI